MRRSVAPVPVSDDSTTSEDKDSNHSRMSPIDESTPRRQLLAAMKRFGKSNVNSQTSAGLDSESTAVTSTSVTMDDEDDEDDDDGGESIQVIDDDHHNPLDEISNASTEDPYTYSDDSASLSDAYFLQQPPLSEFAHHHPSASDYYGLLPLAYTSSDRAAHPSDEWTGPKSIQLGYDKLTEREQRRYRRLRSATPLDEDPINETTSLLDSKASPKIRQRDQNYDQMQVEEMSAPKDTLIASSYIHRQHRKKHQLRKIKRKILIEEQMRKQEERERAVSEVRGQPQPLYSKRDRFWLVLFLLQLFIVCSFAIKYGITFWDVSTAIDQESSTNASDDVASMAATSMVFWSGEDDTMAFKEDDALSDATSEVVQVKPFTIDYKNVLSLLAVAGIYACIISYLNFAFMLILARSIIQIMLVFSSFFLLCLAFFGLMVETNAGKIISLGGFAVFGMSFAYTMSNWNQIPLSSTNFHTAICAMRSSTGVLLVGMVSLFVALLWLLIWTIALMGTFNRNNSADCDVWDECETHVYIYKGRYIEMILLLISLYWTIFVIKNILRVAVAGAIGGPWWFAGMYDGAERIRQQQSIDGCCGWWSRSKVSDSILRACTTSLGTICFGSLVELPAQWLSRIVRFLCWLTGVYDNDSGLVPERTNLVGKITVKDGGNDDEELNNDSEGTHNADNLHLDETSPLPSQKQETSTASMNFGIFQEKLKSLDRTLQNCNRWSYTYIGMYNYSFYEGGEKAIQLFETREWMDIARDALIQNILLMASIVIGGSSGIVAVLVEEVDGYTFTSLHKPIMTAFLIGFFLGFILSNILLLGLAASAVNTVLVCFAAEPFAFDRNHPHLSREMREVWSQQVWEPNAV